MKDAKHTNSQLSVGEFGASGRCVQVNDAERRAIFQAWDWPESLANAERLALVWNSHDDLLAACKAILCDIEYRRRDVTSPGTRETMDTQIRFLRAAIAKAEGRPRPARRSPLHRPRRAERVR